MQELDETILIKIFKSVTEKKDIAAIYLVLLVTLAILFSTFFNLLKITYLSFCIHIRKMKRILFKAIVRSKCKRFVESKRLGQHTWPLWLISVLAFGYSENEYVLLFPLMYGSAVRSHISDLQLMNRAFKIIYWKCLHKEPDLSLSKLLILGRIATVECKWHMEWASSSRWQVML